MTKEQIWLSRKFITYRALTRMWFVGAVWLYFYRFFITDQQIGVLDGLAFAIGLIAEVPSGALADRFGRDKMVKLGQFLAGIGLLMQAFGSSFLPFFVGQSILMIGVSLVSGADEALFYERLKFDKKSKDWRRLVTRASQVSLISALITTIIGGWLHNVEPRLPWILNGLAFILAVITIWSVKDDRIIDKRKRLSQEIKHYINDIRKGFLQYKSPKLSMYVPYIITLQGLFYATGYGLLRLVLLDRFNFNPFWGAVAIAVSSLITIGVLGYMHKNADKLSEKKVINLLGLIAGSSLILALADIGIWGYIVILSLYAGEQVLKPFLSEVLNLQAPENQRATVLSVASFFKTLPYIALAPIIGYLNTHGSLEYFLFSWSILIFASVIFYNQRREKDAQISV